MKTKSIKIKSNWDVEVFIKWNLTLINLQRTKIKLKQIKSNKRKDKRNKIISQNTTTQDPSIIHYYNYLDESRD